MWEHVKPYDETNARHEEVLRTLFERVLDEEARAGADERMKTHRWTEVGFQSANPRTDFRGGGLLGLLCILYLATECKDQFELVKKSGLEKEDFFLAIASINLTSYMQSYLYMNEGVNVPSSHTRVRATRSHFKTFCEVNAQTKKAFFVLHSLAFMYMFTLWRKMVDQNTNSKLPPMFNLAIDGTMDAIHRVLDGRNVENLTDLRNKFEAETEKILTNTPN